MSLSITPENKHTLTVTNEDRMVSPTWAERTNTWDEAVDTWANPGVIVTNEAKHTLSITNENRN